MKKKTKTVRNERTSKGVASKAGALMSQIEKAQGDLTDAIEALSDVWLILRDCRAVAASALTQAPDRKKRVK